MYLPRTTKRYTEIGGVSNGLMLHCAYAGNPKFDLHVSNPITGERAEPVALHSPYHTHLGWGFLARVDGAFALKSYIVVQASLEPTVIVFNVYHSEVGDWKKFTVDERPQKSAAVHDGTLYWAYATGGGVIAYDPEAKPEQQVRLIQDPLEAERRTYDAAHSCVECRGELRYFGGYRGSYDGFPGFSIWKLEGCYEWRLVHKVEGSGDHRRVVWDASWVGTEIVCFDPFDSDVVYLRRVYRGSSIFSYDMKLGDYRERIADEESSSFRWYRFPWDHVLVLPPQPTRVAEKQLERH